MAEQDRLVQQNTTEAATTEEAAKALRGESLNLDAMVNGLSTLVGGGTPGDPTRQPAAGALAPTSNQHQPPRLLT